MASSFPALTRSREIVSNVLDATWPRCSVALIVLGMGSVGCGFPRSDGSLPGFRIPECWTPNTAAAGSVEIEVSGESIWGQSELVEKLSIGREEGDAPYLFGRIESVSTDGENIFVLDGAAYVVRVFDSGGKFKFEFGRRGEGPGEFREPHSLTLGPDGTIYVADSYRLHAFSPTGTLVKTIVSERRLTGPVAVLEGGGLVFGTRFSNRSGWDREGLSEARLSNGGEAEAPCVLPQVAEESPQLIVPQAPGWSRQIMRVPLWPGQVSTVSLQGDVLIADGDKYGVEIRSDAGEVVRLVADRPRVRVGDEERMWWEEYIYWSAHRARPDWQWDGPRIRENLPAVAGLSVDNQGRIWVKTVLAPSTRNSQCTEEFGPLPVRPCWRQAFGFEVWGTNGEYYGQVEVPEQVLWRSAPPFVRENVFIAVVENEQGNHIVKVYDLVVGPTDQGRESLGAR